MPQRDRAKERYWRQLVRQWRRSGLTAREFGAEQGVSEPSFYSWRREIERRARQRKASAVSTTALPSPDRATPAFIQLPVDASATTTVAIEVVLGERRLLRVRPGFSADLLRQLVRLLEEPSC
jgi:hypothetical protein